MSALELGKRSIHGPLVYVVCALITVLGSSIRSDYPLASILVVVSLGILALVRIQYAKGFEARYDRVGERAVRNFVILLLIQCSIFSWSAAATIIHYGEGVESTYALLFGAAAGAASRRASNFPGRGHGSHTRRPGAWIGRGWHRHSNR